MAWLRKFGALPALLTPLLDGCGPIMVPSNSPLPYPEGLRAYLSERWIDREAVHAALGSPTLVRMEGDLEVYVATREVAVELIIRTREYDTHYLLVRYRDDGSVLWQDEVVNAGCAPEGICINHRAGDSASDYWGVAEPELVIVYADEESNRQAREAEPGFNKCVVYPEAENGKPSGFPGLSIELPGQDSVVLPLSGYVAWKGDAQEHPMRVEFGSGGRKQEFSYEFDCAGPQPTYYRLSARRSGFFVPTFAVQLERVDTSIGASGTDSKRLILSH